MSIVMEKDQIFINELKVPEICLRDLAHDNLKRSILHCQACPSAKLTKPLTLHNYEASLMIVGERPDDVLFDSPQGKKLATLLAEAHMEISDIYFTSLSKCKESSKYENCQHHLTAEVMIVRPKLVICLGYSACKLFDPNPNLGAFTQIYPNVHALFTYSLLDATGGQEEVVQKTLREQMNYVHQTLQNMKIA